MTPKQKPHRSRQDYGTPVAFLDAVKKRLGIPAFVHDYAADVDNTVAPDSWFNEEMDALSIPHWQHYTEEGWGWLNPPYTDIGPWAARCAETGAAGGRIAFLVPASVGSNWFRDYVDGKALVLMLNGRLAFMPDKPTWLYPKDTILSLYGPDIEPGYEVWNWRLAARIMPNA